MDNINDDMQKFGSILNNSSILSDFWSNTHPESCSGLQKNSVIKTVNAERQRLLSVPHKRNPKYDEIDINYTIDEFGYRKYPDLDPNAPKKLFCFGCSFTFGHGLPDYETWPYMLVKNLGPDWTVSNFGVHGASFNLIARLVYKIINSAKVKPDYVCFLFPDPFRRFDIKTNGDGTVGYTRTYIDPTPKVVYLTYKETKSFPKHYLHTSILHSFFNTVRSFSLISKIANNNDLNWRWHTWCPFYYQLSKSCIEQYFDITKSDYSVHGLTPIPIPDSGRSRDGTHWGNLTNKNIADMFTRLYTK